MKTRSLLILTAILLFGVLVTIGLVSQSTSIKKSIKPPLATQSKPPTVNMEKRDLLPAAGEKAESSEIRQALFELQALQKGGGSNPQIQEKKVALKAAIESGIKKDPKSVLRLLLNIREEGGWLGFTDYGSLFIQSAPDLAIALLDQVREQDLEIWVVKAIGAAWAKSDPEAAFAWASQQTNTKVKDLILGGVIVSIASKDIKGALAYIQSLSSGASQDSTIPEAFRMAAWYDYQGALAVMQSLPKGRTKDLATKGIILHLSVSGDGDRDAQAAWDMVSVIDDTGIRTELQLKSPAAENADILTRWAVKHPDAAIQWMLSLPAGKTKDLALGRICRGMYYDNPQAAWYLASVIGDEGIRFQAKRFVAWEWYKKDRAAARQWMLSLPVSPARDVALSGVSDGLSMSDRQDGMDLKLRISDTGLRTEFLDADACDWCSKDRAAATQWMQSLPAGPNKDLVAVGMSRALAANDPQAAMVMATGIADKGIRTETQKITFEQWSKKDPAAATQWINRSSLPQEVKTQLLQR
ncbi:MAG: hypothetical protein RI910_811 [Verrucomicrobiota bacterium]|jgi:hypothetical protein